MKEQSEVLQWVQDCRKGSTRAQHKLFKYFYGSVMSVCMRYAGSTDEAADMLNDAYLGLSVVALGLILWLAILLIKDPKGVVKASLFQRK